MKMPTLKNLNTTDKTSDMYSEFLYHIWEGNGRDHVSKPYSWIVLTVEMSVLDFTNSEMLCKKKL